MTFDDGSFPRKTQDALDLTGLPLTAAWRLRDSNPSKCKKPVASCGHQFKNWWQPYALPGAKRPSSPVVLPVHEKSGLFHIVGVCFLGFGIFK